MVIYTSICAVFVVTWICCTMSIVCFSDTARSSYTENDYHAFATVHYMNTNDGGSIFCRICKVLLKSQFKRHFLLKHAVRTRSYSCPACDRMYDNKTYFGNHIRVSHPELSGAIRISDCEVKV